MLTTLQPRLVRQGQPRAASRANRWRYHRRHVLPLPMERNVLNATLDYLNAIASFHGGNAQAKFILEHGRAFEPTS
jgi:hypothetical protein